MKKGNFFSSGTSITNLNLASLILRLVGGGFMLYQHGGGKFLKFFSDEKIEFADPFGIGSTATLALVVFAEAICSILIILGLMTRYALIPLIFTMVYAGFVVHLNDAFGDKELALMYLAIYFALLLIGPGRYSLDRLIKKRRSTISH
ncbi:DoxX family protein [Moheibacter sediminis]|uniref:Putative oxidoreductase n=1 Tax=Moheibacter sediminis TaxID=1434700 RepID=A0A1W2BCN5_9FLAO|nr:DoxX family protein [Moheibacter sediminis]SMC70783.1 putative oxidoreductase [Moheibacter sediminis]